ncbi:polysaccharide deacetylase family protein [Primorskyibacter sp. 2E233]|uniref:polysaccharide deacetylase family protein n=1 Tax=Primorskyibacter sp. 2E233 TaxID=3413431 RepID=UPI003BF3471F
MSILNFHGIGTPHDGVDSSEARYWISAERFCSVLNRVAAQREHGRRILLTFDDGNRSDIDIGVPELRARGLNAHFFMLTGRCDNPHYLSAEDMRALATGEMRVGLHGRDHLDWRRLDPPALDVDIRDAQITLAEIIGQPVKSVAIPFGGYNRRVVKYLKALGFAEIYTSDGSHTSDRHRLRHRLSIRKDMTDAEVDTFLEGVEDNWRPRLIRGAKSFLKEHFI